MSGRVTAIAVSPQGPNTLYVGTASGGVWVSANGGTTWTPITEKLPTQNIGSVALWPGNPDLIWVGTGEGNPRNSQSSGRGIYKSINGGRTWACMGLENTATIHRIVVHRDNPDIVWVGATGSAWGEDEGRGVYKTDNGGKTWKKVLYVNSATGCADLIADPQNPDKLLAAMWEYGREPWFFNSGGDGSGLYVSHDGGDTWKERDAGHGLPKKPWGRIGLAMCQGNPKVMYALVEAEKLALYRSNDGGMSWKWCSDRNVGNRPFYYAEIYVDPKNENRVYSLWSYVSVSEDGGKSFTTIMDYGNGVHPDHHAFYIDPNNPDYLIDGNDGGLNISRDRGKHWQFVEHLPVGQFYHVNHDMEVPYHVYGGLQDNGSWAGPAYVWRHGGIRNHDFEELFFGDGFDVLPVATDPQHGYAMSQGGNLVYYNRLTGQTSPIRPVHPEGISLRFNWNAALAADPFQVDGLYFGSQFVHYSGDRGRHWELLSPDLTTNDAAKQRQAESGGLTRDATTAENHTTIVSIAPSPVDKSTIWVGTDDGNLQLTRDGGKTWTNLIDKLKGAPSNAWIPMIHASGAGAGEAFVVLNNYRQNDWGSYLYHTTDHGTRWDRLALEGVEGYALSVVQDEIEPNLVFLGTENGLWVSIDRGQHWAKWTHGYPSVSTMDLKIHPREGDLIIGTFGRSLYVMDHISPLRELAAYKGVLPATCQPLLFGLSDAYLSQWKSVEGLRFTAQGHYIGDNRPRGAMIDYWIGVPAKDKKVDMVVLTQAGDTVRQLSLAPDTGFNRVYWGLERNGERFPSYQPPGKGAQKPGMFYAPPGQYRVVLHYCGQSATGELTLLADPRTENSLGQYEAQLALVEQHLKVVRAATQGFDQLMDMERQIERVAALVGEGKDTAMGALRTLGNALKDSIKAIQSLVMVPRDLVGYDHVTVRLADRLWQTMGYITGAESWPNQMAEWSYRQTEVETKKVLRRINGLCKGPWAVYVRAVEEAELALAKQMKTIEIEE